MKYFGQTKKMLAVAFIAMMAFGQPALAMEKKEEKLKEIGERLENKDYAKGMSDILAYQIIPFLPQSDKNNFSLANEKLYLLVIRSYSVTPLEIRHKEGTNFTSYLQDTLGKRFATINPTLRIALYKTDDCYPNDALETLSKIKIEKSQLFSNVSKIYHTNGYIGACGLLLHGILSSNFKPNRLKLLSLRSCLIEMEPEQFVEIISKKIKPKILVISRSMIDKDGFKLHDSDSTKKKDTKHVKIFNHVLCFLACRNDEYNFNLNDEYNLNLMNELSKIGEEDDLAHQSKTESILKNKFNGYFRPKPNKLIKEDIKEIRKSGIKVKIINE